MKKKSALLVFSIFLTLSIQAMEYPEKEYSEEKEGKQEVVEDFSTQKKQDVNNDRIALISSDGQEFNISKLVALQVPIFAAIIESSFGDDRTEIKVSIASNILEPVIRILHLQAANPEPYTQNLLQDIHANIIQSAQLSEQEKEELIDAADMYELNLFPAYLADQLYKMYQGNAASINTIIQSYNNRPEFQKKIARYLFLLHGIKLDTIAWEVSVQDLIDYNKIFKRRTNLGVVLQLADLHISDLTGLNNIENKNNIQQIILSNNKLTHIDADSFKGFSLTAIVLSNNNITVIDPAAFNGVNKLQYIDLDNNKITHLNLDIFKDIPMLKAVNLINNPISQEDRFQYPSEGGYDMFVWEQPQL